MFWVIDKLATYHLQCSTQITKQRMAERFLAHVILCIVNKSYLNTSYIELGIDHRGRLWPNTLLY